MKKEYIPWAVAVVVVVVVLVGYASYIEKAPSITTEERTENGVVTVPEPAVPGISPVAEGVVVTEQGTPVRYDVEPGSPEAPRQTQPIAEDEIPAGTIKVSVSFEEGFVPNEFTVRRGEAVTLSFTSVDERTYVPKFREPLSAVAVGIASGETRAITFNAPNQAGEYEFYSDVPGHVNRGLVGKMIVR